MKLKISHIYGKFGSTNISWKVSLITGVLVFFNLLYSVSSLKCYHCLERPKSTERHLSCAYFDLSERFQKECLHSTFCMKRTSMYQLHNGTNIQIYVHKCADQSHRTMVQDKVTGDWNWANLLRLDLYNEGCYPHHAPYLTTKSSHCFCTSDFCNRSSSTGPSKTMVTINSVISMFITKLLLFNVILFNDR